MTYRDFVRKTCTEAGRNITNVGLGLCGEAGEVADLIKKSLYKNTPIDREKILLELGDVVWYLELACDLLGTTREEVEALNRKKLEERWALK